MAVAAPHIPESAPGPIPVWSQIRLLLWLKGKMTLRGFQRSRSALAGTLIAFVLFLPISLALGFAAGYVFLFQPIEIAGQTLRAVLLGIYLLWLIAPMLGFQLNDSYDITRLFAYPISIRRLFVGGILGSLLDFMTLFLLPVLLSACIGFAFRGVFSAVIALVTVPLFLFHTLALSQATLLATAGVLRSRKWRDFAIVIVPLFWVMYQVVVRVLLPRYVSHVNWWTILKSPAWEIVNLLPPGCGARAMTAAAQGAYLPALGFLALLAAYTIGTVYLAAWMIGKAYDGDEVSLFQRGSVAAPSPLSRTSPPNPVSEEEKGRGGIGAILPPVVFAMAQKEMRYFLRDPYFRVVLMQSLYMLVIFGFSFRNAFSGSGLSHHASSLPAVFGAAPIWFATAMLLFQQTTVVYNQFGPDGAAAPLLFGFPASRRQMILGKNLPLFAVLAIENLLLGAGLCLALHSSAILPLIEVWLLLALGVMFSVGNVMSVYLPYKTVVKGFRARQGMATQGAAYTFLYLGVTIGALVLFAPVLAAALVPWYWIDRLWLALTLPLAAVYLGGLYIFSLKWAESVMLDREPEIMTRVYKAME